MTSSGISSPTVPIDLKRVRRNDPAHCPQGKLRSKIPMIALRSWGFCGATGQSISEPSLPSRYIGFAIGSVTHCLQMPSGAADRDRTGTLFRARDFKSLVSACSTTAAFLTVILPHPTSAVKVFCVSFGKSIFTAVLVKTHHFTI